MALNIPPQDDKKGERVQACKGKQDSWSKQDSCSVRDAAHTGKFLDVRMSNGEKFPTELRSKAMDVIKKLKDK